MKKEHLSSLGPFFFLFLLPFLHAQCSQLVLESSAWFSFRVCMVYNFCAATIVNLMLNMLPPKYTETLLCTSVLTNLVIDWDVKDTNFISIKQKVTAACI